MVITLRIEVDDVTLRAFSKTHGYPGQATRQQVKTALTGVIAAFWDDVRDDAERASDTRAFCRELDQELAAEREAA